MSKGKRYDEEPKLNLKKVFAVAIAIIVIIMVIFIMKKLLTKDNKTGKVVSSTYFAVFTDNKWGVINQNGEYVIDPAYQEMIVVPNNKKAVFLCTYDVDYSSGTYKTKALNAESKEIFTQYDNIEAIQNKDENGNLVYDSEVAKVQKNGKYGLVDLAGKEVLACEYDEITAIAGIENCFKIKKDGKYGITNEAGTVVITPQYADIDVLGKDNKSGFIVKDDTGKEGVIDYSGNHILEISYNKIQKVFYNNRYVVDMNGKDALIDSTTKSVGLLGQVDSIKQITADSIIFVKSNKYGLMDSNGTILIEAKYDDLKYGKSGFLIAKQGDKYGIISNNGEEKLPFEYSSISYNEKADIYIAEDSNFKSKILNGNLETKAEGVFIELNDAKGYIKLRDDNGYKYYNFKFEEKSEADIFPSRTLFLSKKDGKYGFVDKDGKVVVDYIYDDAIEQNDYGFSAVKKDGKWGSIDSKGKVVQEPIYNLDDYLLIDFIGKWHLGSDLNMNYYNQNSK